MHVNKSARKCSTSETVTGTLDGWRCKHFVASRRWHN